MIEHLSGLVVQLVTRPAPLDFSSGSNIVVPGRFVVFGKKGVQFSLEK